MYAQLNAKGKYTRMIVDAAIFMCKNVPLAFIPNLPHTIGKESKECFAQKG
jgi:hypothetical protein